jgi:hypothetical protein
VKTSEALIAYFREEAILGKQFRRFRRKHHMPERTIRDQQKKKTQYFIKKRKKRKPMKGNEGGDGYRYSLVSSKYFSEYWI